MDIKVNTVEITLSTVKLTKALLKQMMNVPYHEMQELCKRSKESGKDHILGWIHGSVFGRDEEHKTLLLVERGEGNYGLYEVMDSKRAKFKQIYIP